MIPLARGGHSRRCPDLCVLAKPSFWAKLNGEFEECKRMRGVGVGVGVAVAVGVGVAVAVTVAVVRR